MVMETAVLGVVGQQGQNKARQTAVAGRSFRINGGGDGARHPFLQPITPLSLKLSPLRPLCREPLKEGK